MLLSWAMASGAAAQAPGTPEPAPAPAPAPPAAPAPAPAPAPTPVKLHLSTQGTGGGVLKGDRWRAVVTMTPAVANAKATVTFTARGGKVRTRTVPLRASRDGARAVARIDYRHRSAGRVVVRAAIGDGQPAAPTRATTVAINQATPSLTPGERGPAVRILQSMLRRKAYVVGRPGVFDARTQRAVIAFRKVAGMQWNAVAERGGLPRAARRQGHVPGSVPQARAARRGRHRPPGAGARRRRRQARADLPHVPRQAEHADDPRQLPGLHARSRHQQRRACTSPRTSSAATRSTATRRSRSTTPAPAASASRWPTRRRSTHWITMGMRVEHLLSPCPVGSAASHEHRCRSEVHPDRRAARARARDRRRHADQREDGVLLRRRQAGDPAAGGLPGARRTGRRGGAAGSARRRSAA